LSSSASRISSEQSAAVRELMDAEVNVIGHASLVQMLPVQMCMFCALKAIGKSCMQAVMNQLQ
jgi:hypothetical protein